MDMVDEQRVSLATRGVPARSWFRNVTRALRTLLPHWCLAFLIGWLVSLPLGKTQSPAPLFHPQKSATVMLIYWWDGNQITVTETHECLNNMKAYEALYDQPPPKSFLLSPELLKELNGD